MKPLTETEREAIVPFLELGIDNVWQYIMNAVDMAPGWWCRTKNGNSSYWTHADDATREQYNSLCWIGTIRLRDMHDRFIDENIDGEWEAVHTNWHDDSGNYDPFKTGIPATEPELAAITAALREMSK